MEFKWLGDRFLLAEEVTATGLEIRHVWGYDSTKMAFEGTLGTIQSGYSDSFVGWAKDR